MQCYELSLEGYDPDRPTHAHLLKRAFAPNRHVIDAFLSEHKIYLAEEPLPIDYEGDVDLILDENGIPTYGNWSWWSKECDGISSLVYQDKNIFEGYKEDGKIEVMLNGDLFDPSLSQEIRNHSPNGFNWGYGGSGPAQLALAILLEETGSPKLSEEFYQQFKEDVVSKFEDSWHLFSFQIWDKLEEYISNRRS